MHLLALNLLLYQKSMSRFQGLKKEIKFLQKIFPRTHQNFRIISASLDDITCHFIGKNGEIHPVLCNITVCTTSASPYKQLLISNEIVPAKVGLVGIHLFVIIIVGSVTKIYWFQQCPLTTGKSLFLNC